MTHAIPPTENASFENASFENAVADPAALRRALSEAQIGTSLMLLLHLSGDASLIDEIQPHVRGPWPWLQDIPPALQQSIRERLVAVLQRFAASGQQAPPDLAPELMRRLMSAGVGADVPAAYLPLMLEETAMGRDDTRRFAWHQRPAPEVLAGFTVAIVGAGFSGICAAIRLQEAGIPFVIYDKNPTAAGTWYENDYPGCGVDTISHFYAFSFRPNHSWSHYYAKRDEIYRYLEDTVDAYDLRRHMRFGIEVTEMRFDEASHSWLLTHVDRNGRVEQTRANAVISAVGLVNRPSEPDIENLDAFKGPKLHTAAWDKSVDLAGKRVAMIGTGASGMQVGPSLAPDVEQLSVFQRSAHWVAFNPLYHAPVAAGQRWALDNIPYFSQWQRFLFFWGSSDALHASLHVDPEWPQPAQSLNAANHKVRETLEAHIRKELADRPDLVEKCIPPYPPYGKRMLRDNHWYAMLTRPNVDLVTEGVSHATSEGLVTKDGVLHEVDAIVFATGFSAGRMLWPMNIVGRNGVTIRELWGDDDPRAYKGITVPGFPNLFVTSGPNTGLAHGGSHFFHSECQVRYIGEALRQMLENGWATVEVRQDAHDRFNEDVEARARHMVWAHPGVNSWYKNAAGRVTIVSPWLLLEYWDMTREFDAARYDIVRVARDASQDASQDRPSRAVTAGAD